MFKIKNILVSFLVIILFIRIAAPLTPVFSDTVLTDASIYTQGQTVTVIGKGASSTEVLINVTYGDVLINMGSTLTDGNGNYTYSFILANDTALGDYTVKVLIGETFTINTFKVVSDEESLADNLLTMVEKSKFNAEQLLNDYSFKNINDKQKLDDKMTEANTAYTNAQNLIDEKNFSNAIDQLRNALSLYGYVISEIQNDDKVNDQNTYNSALSSIEISEKIDRLQDQANYLKQRADALSDLGFNVDNIINLINQVKDKLTEAKSLVDTSIEEAQQNVSDAIKMLNDADKMIRDLNKANTVNMAQKFMEKAQERAEKLNQQINHLLDTNASERAREAVNSAFQHIIQHLNEIKGSLNSENLEEKLNEINNNSKEVRSTYKYLGNNNDEKNMLKDIQRLETELELLNGSVNRATQRGANTTELAVKLGDAAYKLKEAQDVLGTNNTKANDLLKQVDNLLNEVQKDIYTHSLKGISLYGENTQKGNTSTSNKGDKGENSKPSGGGHGSTP